MQYFEHPICEKMMGFCSNNMEWNGTKKQILKNGMVNLFEN